MIAGILILVLAVMLAARCKKPCRDCGARYPLGGVGRYDTGPLCNDENACARRGG